MELDLSGLCWINFAHAHSWHNLYILGITKVVKKIFKWFLPCWKANTNIYNFHEKPKSEIRCLLCQNWCRSQIMIAVKKYHEHHVNVGSYLELHLSKWGNICSIGKIRKIFTTPIYDLKGQNRRILVKNSLQVEDVMLISLVWQCCIGWGYLELLMWFCCEISVIWMITSNPTTLVKTSKTKKRRFECHIVVRSGLFNHNEHIKVSFLKEHSRYLPCEVPYWTNYFLAFSLHI